MLTVMVCGGGPSEIPDAAQLAPSPTIEPADTPIAPDTPGAQPSPPAMSGMIAPDLRLTFQGVDYSGVEILGSADGPIICCGTPVDPDDMEAAGTRVDHTPEEAQTVPVYRPKACGTTDIHTFSVAQTLAAPETGGSAKTRPRSPGCAGRQINGD